MLKLVDSSRYEPLDDIVGQTSRYECLVQQSLVHKYRKKWIGSSVAPCYHVKLNNIATKNIHYNIFDSHLLSIILRPGHL